MLIYYYQYASNAFAMCWLLVLRCSDALMQALEPRLEEGGLGGEACCGGEHEQPRAACSKPSSILEHEQPRSGRERVRDNCLSMLHLRAKVCIYAVFPMSAQLLKNPSLARLVHIEEALSISRS